MKYTELLAKASGKNQLLTALFELTYQCNWACEFCYNDLSLEGRPLQLKDYRRVIDDLAELQVLNITLSGGEPMIHPDFFAIGNYAKRKRFAITVKTNAIPLTQRNIGRLIDEIDPARIESSLHGACASTHDRLTRVPGSFDKMIHNIRLAVKAGLIVKLNCPLTRYNENEVDGMYTLADDLGVTLVISPEISPKDDGDMSPLELRASSDGIAGMYRAGFRYQKTLSDRLNKAGEIIPIRTPTGVMQSNESMPSKGKVRICGTGSSSATIDPFGNVYPCVQFRRKIGNVHDQPISHMWAGENETLEEIRGLAVKAYDSLEENGVRHFCMGTAELKTGNPLTVHDQERESVALLDNVRTEHGL
jgi:radical SAM protein with 4Fe4S-binding SPASM domain